MTRVLNYRDEHFDGVDRLWREVFPGAAPRNRAENAIPSKVALGDGLFWVALDGKGQVIGTAMAGWDGHRGWLYLIATSPDHRRKGVGKALVERAVAELGKRGCGKVNLQIRADNVEVASFYASLGFIEEPRMSMGRELPG
ncbi:GNAT family acetyltransferase [Erythrobacter sp. GH1-10]|uniref:GNAT family acetyltransferase n=1 Tax=Erythrobacter sp. GH1-10 TaxID=3349334 RepID=UPI003877BD4A